MELKLKDGGYVFSDSGPLEEVSGADERLQRILCRLSARRGGFFLLPGFGSRLHTLTALKPSQRPAAARQFVHEALEPEEGLEVLEVEYADAGEGGALITVKLSLDGADRELSLSF